MNSNIPEIQVHTDDNTASIKQLPDNQVFNNSAESWETDDSSVESDKTPATKTNLPDLSESSSDDSNTDSSANSSTDSESDETQETKPKLPETPNLIAPANDLLNKMRQARDNFEKRQSIIPENPPPPHPEEKLAAKDIVTELASRLNVLTIPKTRTISKSPNRRKSTILKPSFEPKKFEMSNTKTTDLFIGEIHILDKKSDQKSVQNILPKPKSLVYKKETTNEFMVSGSLEIETIRSITFGLTVEMFSNYFNSEGSIKDGRKWNGAISEITEKCSEFVNECKPARVFMLINDSTHFSGILCFVAQINNWVKIEIHNPSGGEQMVGFIDMKEKVKFWKAKIRSAFKEHCPVTEG